MTSLICCQSFRFCWFLLTHCRFTWKSFLLIIWYWVWSEWSKKNCLITRQLTFHTSSSLSFLAILPDQVSTDGGMLWCPNWTNQHYPGPRSSSRRKGPLSVLAVRQSCPHEPTGKLTGRDNNCCFFLFPLAGLSEETFLSVTIWLWQSVLKVPTISPSHGLLCWSSSLHSVAAPVRG